MIAFGALDILSFQFVVNQISLVKPYSLELYLSCHIDLSLFTFVELLVIESYDYEYCKHTTYYVVTNLCCLHSLCLAGTSSWAIVAAFFQWTNLCSLYSLCLAGSQ